MEGHYRLVPHNVNILYFQRYNIALLSVLYLLVFRCIVIDGERQYPSTRHRPIHFIDQLL